MWQKLDFGKQNIEVKSSICSHGNIEVGNSSYSTSKSIATSVKICGRKVEDELWRKLSQLIKDERMTEVSNK